MEIDICRTLIPLVLGFHGCLDFMDFWTRIFGLGFLDLMDLWISLIFGFDGFLDFVHFHCELGTVCVQGTLTSQKNDNYGKHS